MGWSQSTNQIWSKLSAPGCAVQVNPTYRIALTWTSADTLPAVASYDLSQSSPAPTVQFGATKFDPGTGAPVSFNAPLSVQSGKVDVTVLPDPKVFAVSAGSVSDLTLVDTQFGSCVHITLSQWNTTK